MRPAALLAPMLLVAGLATAQPRARRDAGASIDAGPAPHALVAAARGGLREVESFGGALHGPGGDVSTERLGRLAVGRCYALLGAATGSAQVRASVRARSVTVLAPVPLANSRGEAERRDFCVRYPADWYELVIAPEGEVRWHVTLAELPPDASAPEAPAPQRDAGVVFNDTPPSADALTFRPEPVGGDAQDYVGSQLRAYARARPRLVGFSPAARATLATNEAWTARYALPAGRCVELVAAGVPSVGDLVLELEDPGGARVAQDGTHRATEAVRHCPRYAGTYTARVRMFAGHGAVAIQLLTEP